MRCRREDALQHRVSFVKAGMGLAQDSTARRFAWQSACPRKPCASCSQGTRHCPIVHWELGHLESFGLALSRIQDPGNVGTMIRTAAAAGIDELWVSGDSVELDHPKVMRASAGQWFRLPMVTVEDLGSQIIQAKQAGIQVVTTVPTADRIHWEADFTKPTLVVMGNEGAGLSPEIADLADVPVRIPLARGVESLNVAIAAAIILYEVQRQRQMLIQVQR